ncbi:MAG TPA: hypothetical protein VFB27_10810 [Opitutaceae bacterium]|nr:hypothetical protein [Opitutaceae bacterium]
MKTATLIAKPTPLRTYLFGSLALYRDAQKQTYSLKLNAGRLALVLGLTAFVVYGGVVATGYFWLREVRKIEQVGLFDVAFFRASQVRREMAAQQFAKARTALAAKDYNAAFVGYTSGLHNDPDNVEGRLQAAEFLQTVGATDRAVVMLEEGLTRLPDNRPLLERTLDLLTTSGRDADALKLLHGQLAAQFSGPNGPLLRTYEILGTLNTDGPAAARSLLDASPDLRATTSSLPVIARVLWESKQPLEAISTLQSYLKAKPDNFAAYAQLAEYQDAAGLIADARHTADLACAQLPGQMPPRVLRIGVLKPRQPGEVQRWEQEVAAYLKEFGGKPEGVALLANLAGREGWVDLARMLYESAAGRGQDVRMLAMYYSDALMMQRQFTEARSVLAEIDRQTPEGGGYFSVLLLQREVVVAAACGDRDDAREQARRVAAALRLDPDGLEVIRRRFVKLGISEAVAELGPRIAVAKPAAPKKS